MTAMLSCQELTELVTDYLEGRLKLGDRISFRMHVAMCPSCREYLHQMELTVNTVGELCDAEIPSDVKDELMSAFQDWKKVR